MGLCFGKKKAKEEQQPADEAKIKPETPQEEHPIEPNHYTGSAFESKVCGTRSKIEDKIESHMGTEDMSLPPTVNLTNQQVLTEQISRSPLGSTLDSSFSKSEVGSRVSNSSTLHSTDSNSKDCSNPVLHDCSHNPSHKVSSRRLPYHICNENCDEGVVSNEPYEEEYVIPRDCHSPVIRYEPERCIPIGPFHTKWDDVYDSYDNEDFNHNISSAESHDSYDDTQETSYPQHSWDQSIYDSVTEVLKPLVGSSSIVPNNCESSEEEPEAPQEDQPIESKFLAEPSSTPSTALRWTHKLVQMGLKVRSPGSTPDSSFSKSEVGLRVSNTCINSKGDTNREYLHNTYHEIQLLKLAERQKYYKGLVRNVKEIKELKTANDEKKSRISTSKLSTSKTETFTKNLSCGYTSEIKSESNTDFREPHRHPFAKIQRIFCKISPSVSTKTETIQEIGISPENVNSNSDNSVAFNTIYTIEGEN